MLGLPYSKKVDTLLALTIFGLVLFGIVMIYSASVVVGLHLFDDERHFFKRQVVWSILGLTGMAVTANIHYEFWKKHAGLMLGATFLLLISVFFFSKGEINGAHRWIAVAGQTFQPSELAKLTFIMYASAWLMQRQKTISSIPETFLPYVGVLAAISVLMLMQPDLGTLSIILVGAISIYVVAGLTWKQAAVGLGILVVGLTIATTINPYMKGRILTFLDPSRDTADKSYHVNNIAIAIGSGGLTGLGFGESKQKLLYLPEPQTDSIFAIINEELGFIWGAIVIAAYCFLFYRGYAIAMRAPDMFAQLVAVGITSWFAFQTFINLGSMLHLVPLVGVPLPFVSYGGTNLLISLLAAGILLNISRYAQDPQDKPVRAGAGVRKSRYATGS